jgi:hypothetical protein
MEEPRQEFRGPDMRALGELTKVALMTQSRIAAILAACSVKTM